MRTTISHHWFRRRARAKADRLTRRAAHLGWTDLSYVVEQVQRGRSRWRVVQVKS